MKRYFILALSALFFLLAGCSAANNTSATNYDAGYESFGGGEHESQAKGLYMTNAFSTSGEMPTDGRYRIAEVQIYLQTKNYDELNDDIQTKLKELGGYVEARNEKNYDAGRQQSLTLRVPSDKLDLFIEELDKNEKASKISSDISFTDVTDEMIETGSRKKALEAEESALLALLQKAETVDDIIRVQERLSSVRGDLESYLLRLQQLNNQVSYSSVYIDISEVELIAEPTQSFISLSGTGFMNSLKNIGEGLKTFGIWVVSSIPYFLIAALVVISVLLLIKRRKKKLAAEG